MEQYCFFLIMYKFIGIQYLISSAHGELFFKLLKVYQIYPWYPVPMFYLLIFISLRVILIKGCIFYFWQL